MLNFDKKFVMDDKSKFSQTIEIASTLKHGILVFDNLEKFNHWALRENKYLEGKRPFELMNTLAGLKKVNTLLTRIEEGVYI